jgi:hypothetical protein
MDVDGKIPVETIPGMMEGGGDKKNAGGVNSSKIYLIYCKNLYKFHNLPPPSKTIKKDFFPNCKSDVLKKS